MKKLLCLLCSIVLLFSFVACGDTEREEMEFKDGKYVNTLKVSMARYTSPSMEEMLATTENAETAAYNRYNVLFKEKLNIEIEYDWIADSSQYSQKVDLTLVSGNIPDFFAVDATQLKDLVKADLIWDMTSIYDQYATDLSREIMESEENSFKAATIDGKLMALPETNGSTVNVPFLWIRQDWLDNLQLAAPKTIDDVIDIAYAFRNNDPDGDGIKNTYGLGLHQFINNPMGGWLGFLNAYGAYSDFWIDDSNGNIVYSDIQPEVKLALSKLNQMYKDGVINQEFYQEDDAKINEDANSGKIGMFYGQHWMPLNLQSCHELDSESNWVCYPVLGQYEGAKPKLQLFEGTSRFWVASKKTKNPEALMHLYNLLWEVNTDNQYSYYKNSEDATEAWWFNPIQVSPPSINIDEWNTVQNLKNGGTGGEDDPRWVQCKSYMEDGAKGDKYWGVYKIYCEENCSMKYLNQYLNNNQLFHSSFAAAPTTAMAKNGLILNELKLEAFHEMVKTSGNVDKVFNDFVTNWKSLGGDTMTQEVNEVMN